MEETIIPIATEAAEYYGGLPSAQEVAFLEYQHELWKEDPKAWSPFISLEQLQNRPNLEIEWYAPNFIPVGGKVLLSAEPKCGKTILLFHILNAVVNGRSFLEEKCTPAKVMYFTEQTEHEFKRQVREVPGLLGNPNFYVLLAEEVPANLRSWRLLLQFAEEKMKVIGAHIIIFDTFIGMARLPADGENDSATIQNCIDEANFLFKNRYLSIVFVHHARKSFEDSKGPRAVTMQSIRGSSAFVGGVGHVICMTAPDYTNTIRQCNFFGRYLHGTEMKLILIDGQYRQAGFKRG